MVYEHLDEELINELLEGGRASLRSLAEELDVSVTTISNHLSDLEEENIIKGYTPIIDYEKVGYDVTAVMQFKVEGGALPDITDILEEHRQILSVYEVTGNYDITAIGKYQDTDDMNSHIKSLLDNSDIKQSSTSVVLNPAKENERFELRTEEED